MENDLGIIAGRGVYPLELAESARKQGVGRLCAVGFVGETRRELGRLVDEIKWIRVGELGKLLEGMRGFGVSRAVMAGQIRPRNLFVARVDGPMRALLARLPRRNADTIFGAVGEELKKVGVELIPASRYMESRIVWEAGVLTGVKPTEQDWQDIRQGYELAKMSSRFQCGQSVAVKEGTVIAVEGFEGTDRMIQRAGKVGGGGCVIVKVAREGHDLRWDIPVVGLGTLRSLRRGRCRCLALEAGRAVLLEREALVAGADAAGIPIVVVS